VNLPAVAAVYDRMLRQPERTTLPDVQHVWRAVSLSLWLRQIQGSPA
jgi:asparagine synthase (glutamine-hydrolysing)